MYLESLPKLSADDCADSTTGTRLGQIADALRGMAPGHLAGIEDESERCGSGRDLAVDVEFLEGLGALLAPVDILGRGLRRDDEDLNQTVNPHATYPGITIMRAAMAGHMLKRMSDLDRIFRFAIEITAPAALVRPLLADLRKKTPIPATVRRARFSSDAAFSLLMRPHVALARPCWFWADSSPQGGRNWLLSQM